jgi:hypothetical protein
MLLLLLACNGSSDTGTFGTGLFSEGCPEGDVINRRIEVDSSLPGQVAVGTLGDWLVANEEAAFVISDPGKFDGPKGPTYWYYGGAIIDAVAMDGCEPATDDMLDEIGLVIGEIDIADIGGAVLRAFRGESVEPLELADGRRGVRVHGVDDLHWLVEYTLIGDNPGRSVSEAFGLAITVDYTLLPDSPVLHIDIHVENIENDEHELVAAALFSFAPKLESHAFAANSASFGGETFGTNVPWLVAASESGSIAYGIENGNLTFMSISGVKVAADATQVLGNSIKVGPGQSESRSSYLAVGPGGGPTATGPLSTCNPDPVLGQAIDLSKATGQITGPDGPVAGAQVRLEASSDGDSWDVLDVTWTHESGDFELRLPAYDWEYRLEVIAPGWKEARVPVDSHTFAEPRGAVAVSITDTAGNAQAARLVFDDIADGDRRTYWVADRETLDLPVGTWDFTATRGFEYAPQIGTLEVQDQGAELAVVLDLVVDTTGWMSVDTHVHSSDSTDSDVPPEGQLLRAAAHGLDVVLFTEHENVVDRTSVPADHGLDPWVACVTGEEVTASLPEHMTLFPVVPDGSERGGPVDWYGLAIDQIFDNMRTRSPDGISMINHPGYLDDIGWDRVTASPTITDSTLFGLPPDQPVWDWNIDGLEVMNGTGSPFSRGRFDNWQSMLNAGFAMTGTASSDSHSGGDIGFPRSYFPSSSDQPAELDIWEMVQAYRDGDVIMSAGAFARVEASEPIDGFVALSVHIEAMEQADITHFVVFESCDQVLSIAAQDPDGIVKFDGVVQVPVPTETDSTLTVAAFGRNYLPAGLPQYDATSTPRVMSNALWIDGDGDGALGPPGGRECLYDLAEPE